MNKVLLTFPCTFLIVISADASASSKTVSALGEHDNNNAFARILRRDMRAIIVFEDENVLIFEYINSLKPSLILVSTKGKYRSMGEFSTNFSKEQIVALIRVSGKLQKIQIKQTNFSTIANVDHDVGNSTPLSPISL